MSGKRDTRSTKSNVTKILVCFAVREEAAAFQTLVPNRDDVSILITGVGRSNAEGVLIARLRACLPRLVFTCGFAGGLDPELKLGDVVFETENCDMALCQRLTAARARPAKFFCAARIATTAAEKRELHRATDADAVEMESAAIHAVCRGARVSCATVRVISDTAEEDLPLDFNRLANVDLSVNYAKLAWAVAKSPGKIPALLRLHKNTTFAAKQLAEVLEKVIWPK